MRRLITNTTTQSRTRARMHQRQHCRYRRMKRTKQARELITEAWIILWTWVKRSLKHMFREHKQQLHQLHQSRRHQCWPRVVLSKTKIRLRLTMDNHSRRSPSKLQWQRTVRTTTGSTSLTKQITTTIRNLKVVSTLNIQAVIKAGWAKITKTERENI